MSSSLLAIASSAWFRVAFAAPGVGCGLLVVFAVVLMALRSITQGAPESNKIIASGRNNAAGD
jgi:hypothetical protein